MASRVAEILHADADLYERKAADYSPDPARRFENFEEAARFASGVTGKALEPVDVAIVLMGVKLARLRSLGVAGVARNEAVVDTLRDLRVYAAIVEAMILQSVTPARAGQAPGSKRRAETSRLEDRFRPAKTARQCKPRRSATTRE